MSLLLYSMRNLDKNTTISLFFSLLKTFKFSKLIRKVSVSPGGRGGKGGGAIERVSQ